jgi:hypothetical protein
VTSTNATTRRNDADQPTRSSGALIINADDWGRDRETTDRTLECFNRGAISSVSAMMFMEDTERSAAIAQDRQIDAGLHLNLTLDFSGSAVPQRLRDHQLRLSRILRKHRFAAALYYPALANSFEYVVASQRAEFVRLYGKEPEHWDGHHHMHLASNVLLGGLLPPGIMTRRNFSFFAGEKSIANRLYRRATDALLARTRRVTDFFFSLPPLHPRRRIEKIVLLAAQHVVEVETHPAVPEEYAFLSGGALFTYTKSMTIAPRYMVRQP